MFLCFEYIFFFFLDDVKHLFFVASKMKYLCNLVGIIFKTEIWYAIHTLMSPNRLLNCSFCISFFSFGFFFVSKMTRHVNVLTCSQKKNRIKISSKSINIKIFWRKIWLEFRQKKEQHKNNHLNRPTSRERIHLIKWVFVYCFCLCVALCVIETKV